MGVMGIPVRRPREATRPRTGRHQEWRGTVAVLTAVCNGYAEKKFSWRMATPSRAGLNGVRSRLKVFSARRGPPVGAMADLARGGLGDGRAGLGADADHGVIALGGQAGRLGLGVEGAVGTADGGGAGGTP
jgi:hypothetical protein